MGPYLIPKCSKSPALKLWRASPSTHSSASFCTTVSSMFTLCSFALTSDTDMPLVIVAFVPATVACCNTSPPPIREESGFGFVGRHCANDVKMAASISSSSSAMDSPPCSTATTPLLKSFTSDFLCCFTGGRVSSSLELSPLFFPLKDFLPRRLPSLLRLCFNGLARGLRLICFGLGDASFDDDPLLCCVSTATFCVVKTMP